MVTVGADIVDRGRTLRREDGGLMGGKEKQTGERNQLSNLV